MNRAYSLLEVKGLDSNTRTFSGVATTPSLDRDADRIDPLKAAFAPEIPLLHQHKHDAPIGRVRFGKATKDGIAFEAEIPHIAEPGPLQDRVNTAWGEIKHGLVRGVSIGFKPTEQPTLNKSGGLDFGGIEIWELSTVTIPANSQALISVVKSIDEEVREHENIVDVPTTDIPAEPTDDGATAKAARVVRLDAPAGVSAPPFVIREIKRTS
jgi:HK97 family phage prohead protease